MKRRRVLLMVRALVLGGSERQTAVVASRLDPERFDCIVGCWRPEGIRGDELRAASIPIKVFPVRGFTKPGALVEGLRLTRFIRKERIDLVHTFDPPMNVFSVPFARLARSCKVLSSMRTHRELTPGLMHRLLRVSDRLVDGIVVNCESVRRHLIADEAVAAERIQLCYNGIDLSQFHSDGRTPAPEFAGGSLVIGTVCALRPEKGLTTLLDAFARVCSGRPELRLAFVGSGPMSAELKSQAAAAGCGGQVVFIPETADVPRLLRAIDIFVLPSLSEALSNSLMEAMACGCCPVASRVGGNPELVEAESNGLLFEAGDAAELTAHLERLIADAALRRRLAVAAAERIRSRFSVDASIAQMTAIYDRILR